jgi:4-cresol dehydrogenase (hydroxylating)
MNLLEPIYARHGFDTLVTFTMITERAMVCVSNISYDKRIPEEAERAHACYEELMTALMQAGFYPYRTGPTGYGKIRPEGDPYWDLVHTIKRTVDPRDTISPGRYLAPQKPHKQDLKKAG